MGPSQTVPTESSLKPPMCSHFPHRTRGQSAVGSTAATSSSAAASPSSYSVGQHPQPPMFPDVATAAGQVAREEDSSSSVAHAGRAVQMGCLWLALISRTSSFLLPWSLKSSL